MSAPSPEALRTALAAQLATRGYVLPHHGLMAAALPDLAAAYGPMYAALTITPHHLSALDRECIWLTLLIADGQAVGTHHLELFLKLGGTDDQARALLRLAAHAAGAARYAFIDGAWAPHWPGGDGAREYLAAADALAPALPQALTRACLAAAATLLRDAWGLRATLPAALHAGMAEGALAEAIALTIWPGGVNRLVEAADIWLGLIRDGAAPASEAFRAWAETPGQGPLRLPKEPA